MGTRTREARPGEEPSAYEIDEVLGLECTDVADVVHKPSCVVDFAGVRGGAGSGTRPREAKDRRELGRARGLGGIALGLAQRARSARAPLG